MASAKSHTGTAVLSASSTIYYNRETENGGGPGGWRIQPTEDVDVYFKGTYLGTDTVEAVRILADEDFPIYDPDQQITEISAQAVTTDGTISIRPLTF